MDKRNFSPTPSIKGLPAVDCYWLEHGTTSPSRIVGRDELGRAIEETVPAAYSRMFVMPDGCANDVPMRTWCGTYSSAPQDVSYEQTTTRDLILAGAMPLDVCPFTDEYAHITGGKLARTSAGETNCGGKPDGCEHMKKIMTARQALARSVHDKQQIEASNLTASQVQKMMSAAVAGGIEMQKAAIDPGASAKERLRQNKGE